MKHSRILSMLALTVILALLVVAIPATPVAAQAIVCSPSTGTPGTPVTVTGTGFTAYIGQPVFILFNYSYASSATVVGGAFTASFSVPTTTTAGTTLVTVQHTTLAYDPTKQITMTSFTVTVPTIALSPSSAGVGTTVTVNGTGFTASSNVTITFDNANPVTASTDANGSFTATFTIPESSWGSHTIKATDTSGRYDTASFTTQQSLTITPTSGAVGDTVSVSGTAFRGSRPITVTYDGTAVNTSPVSIVTDGNGSFSAAFNVPAGASGTHTVVASDGTYTSSVNFTTTASFNLGQTTGHVSDKVTASGSGFMANQVVTITFANTQVKTITTDATGSFSDKFTVPAYVTGIYNVVASDNINAATTTFEVLVDASLSQSTGNVGTEITISGIGFSGTVTIKYDNVEVTTAAADASGAFSATFNAPASTGGAHVITASDGTNTIQNTFAMESEAPPTPAPLLPEVDTKTKAEAYFDWEDVSDPSGVAYTLQIATDENFTDDSIILEQKGLAESEYTITEEEKLESTKKEAPYYWRVKAIDDASNESAWSTLASFYVGFSLTLPDQAKYALIGVGGVLIGFLGFWLGRRTAYSY